MISPGLEDLFQGGRAGWQQGLQDDLWYNVGFRLSYVGTGFSSLGWEGSGQDQRDGCAEGSQPLTPSTGCPELWLKAALLGGHLSRHEVGRALDRDLARTGGILALSVCVILVRAFLLSQPHCPHL